MNEGFNQFSLEFFAGHIRGKISTPEMTYELVHTCPHVPFPGYVGLVEFYGTGVTAKSIFIENAEMPFGKKVERKSDGFDYDLFICHSSRDRPIIESIIKEFKREHIRYWLDGEQINFGDQVTQKIEAGLLKSEYVMPCLSVSFIQSG